jgi:hypothetical protein
MAVDQTSRTAMNTIESLKELKGKLSDDQSNVKQSILDLIEEIQTLIKELSGRAASGIEAELKQEAKNKEFGQQIRYADGC